MHSGRIGHFIVNLSLDSLSSQAEYFSIKLCCVIWKAGVAEDDGHLLVFVTYDWVEVSTSPSARSTEKGLGTPTSIQDVKKSLNYPIETQWLDGKKQARGRYKTCVVLSKPDMSKRSDKTNVKRRKRKENWIPSNQFWRSPDSSFFRSDLRSEARIYKEGHFLRFWSDQSSRWFLWTRDTSQKCCSLAELLSQRCFWALFDEWWLLSLFFGNDFFRDSFSLCHCDTIQKCWGYNCEVSRDLEPTSRSILKIRSFEILWRDTALSSLQKMT